MPGEGIKYQFGNIVMQRSEVGAGDLAVSEYAFPLNIRVGEIVVPETMA